MQNNFKYINLSWAVVGICERPWVGNQRSGMNARQPLLFHITSSATWPSGISPLSMKAVSCPATTMPCATMPAAR